MGCFGRKNSILHSGIHFNKYYRGAHVYHSFSLSKTGNKSSVSVTAQSGKHHCFCRQLTGTNFPREKQSIKQSGFNNKQRNGAIFVCAIVHEEDDDESEHIVISKPAAIDFHERNHVISSEFDLRICSTKTIILNSE